MNRPKQEPDQLYVSLPPIRPLSLRKSPSTTDSFTTYSESDKSYSHRSTTSLSETSVSSGRGSPSVSDYGGHSPQRKDSNRETARPAPRTAARSERMPTNTSSIISDSPSQHRHPTQVGSFPQTIRPGARAGEFYFPRPNDDGEIEALYQEIKRSFNFGNNTLNLTVDQKWRLVYDAEQIRWSEERRREQQIKQRAETIGSAPPGEGSPEWYIRKFMDQTITPIRVSSLEVSLRSNPLRSALSQCPPPSVTEEFSAGSSTSFLYKVLLCLHKPLCKYQGRAIRGDR